MTIEHNADGPSMARLAARGWIPHDLDGHFVIAEDAVDGTRVRASRFRWLRIQAGRVSECRDPRRIQHLLAGALGALQRAYAHDGAGQDDLVPPRSAAPPGVSALGALSRVGVRLHRRGASQLEWGEEPQAGSARRGIVRLEPELATTEALLTSRHLIMLAHERAERWGGAPPRHHVGVARLAERSEPYWHICPSARFTALVHAHDGALPTADLMSRSTRGAATARIDRVHLSIDDRSARVERLYEGPLGSLRIHPARAGRSYRYLYWVAPPVTPVVGPSLVRFEVASRSAQSMPLGFARSVGAPTLVPAASPSSEDESVHVLAVVYDAVTDATELSIVSADAAGRLISGVARLDTTLRHPARGVWLPSVRASVEEADDNSYQIRSLATLRE